METFRSIKRLRRHEKSNLAADLAKEFGPRSAICRRCVAKLYGLIPADSRGLAAWRGRFEGILGIDWQQSANALRAWAGKLGIERQDFEADAFLFALQTYFSLLVELLVKRGPALNGINFSVEPFGWRFAADKPGMAAELQCLSAAMQRYSPLQTEQGASASGDLLKDLYEALFPRSLRHRLGEYYTPDWLAEHVLDQLGYDGRAGERLLDPACGSGTFLLAAIRRIRAAWAPAHSGGADAQSAGDLCKHIFSHVVGIDLNPLAATAARGNYLMAIQDILPQTGQVEVPVYLGDSILGSPSCDAARLGQFDVVAGNPPWIAWDNLPADYRQATKPLWERYGLFSLSGNEGRHGGGKKDLSMLMLYAVADKHLKSGGRLGFVITQTLFQTKGAGDGFRRFRLGRAGEPLAVKRVDDFVGMRPFDGAANWTAAVVIEKGSATQYPVPYIKWRSVKDANRAEQTVLTALAARPIDAMRAGSPWFLQPEGFTGEVERLIGPSDYEAHLGANTGGANGVYWVELLRAADGGVLVSNVSEKSKAEVDVIEAVIEPDLLYPLLRWRDVARYDAQSSLCLLLAQDCATRSGISEAVMREKYPRTLEYLRRFRSLLEGRAAYRRYQRGRPFYSMYNIGPYTTAPVKVVWRRMDRRINAAVAADIDSRLLGRRPIIPQETCAMVACRSHAEAHYLCAVLNSAPVNFLIQAHSVEGGKGFGTPSMLKYLSIRRFDPKNAVHSELAECSEGAHKKPDADVQKRIDCLAAELYGLDPAACAQ